MDKELEEGSRLQLDFTKLAKVAATGAEVVPAIAQDVDTGEVLILGYVNHLALETALKERKATFWSTSRNELWIKGKTSGDYLELIEVRVNGSAAPLKSPIWIKSAWIPSLSNRPLRNITWASTPVIISVPLSGMMTWSQALATR